MSELIYIPISSLREHPYNPRKNIGDVTELSESIKANGVLQNLTVVPSEQVTPDAIVKQDCPSYTIIIGHRRYAAAKIAGITELPCVVVDMTAKEQMQTMLVENMQRSDLTVYEQAQGFQMMLDLGSTVEEIAEKSGFSVTTVRRRVKMMELDQEKLRMVSERQLSLADFDRLAQIEDIKDRNSVLASIGTNDFNQKLAAAINKQKRKHNLPLIKAWLKEVGAKEIPKKDCWSSKYDSLGPYLYVDRWGEEGYKPPKLGKEPVFYQLEDNWLRLFKKHEKAKPQKKSEEELKREKELRDAWAKVDEAAALAYNLRKAFIENLSLTNKNRAEVMRGALLAALLEAIEYNSPDRKTLNQAFGIETDRYDSKRTEKFASGVNELKDQDIPKLVYALFGDGETEACLSTRYRSAYPEYKLSEKLRLIYNWLYGLGYEMSTEEIQLMNGNHEIYKAGGQNEQM